MKDKYNLEKIKIEQLDCEWCPRHDVKGYQIVCNLDCLHYICLKCVSKIKGRSKEKNDKTN